MSRGRLIAMMAIAVVATASAYVLGTRLRPDSGRSDDSARPAAARTDKDGNLVIALAGEPHAVAVGAGKTWVLGADRGGRPAVTAIDPVSGRSGTPTVLKEEGGAIGAGEGAVWVHAAGRLTRIDARSGGVRSSAVKAHPGARGLAVGAGAVWLLSGDGVLRVDPRSGRVLRSIRLLPAGRDRIKPGCEEGATRTELITIGAGSVWATSTTTYTCGSRRAGYHELSRIDPDTERVTLAVALRRPYAELAVGRSGAWGTAGRELQRMDVRDGGRVAAVRVPAGGGRGLGVSRDAVWIGQAGEDGDGGVLRRVDRASGRVSTVLELERPPAGVAIGEGGVWVLDGSARRLIRVTP